MLADENEFQTRVSFFADLDVADRLAMIQVRREIVESRVAHGLALRPDATVQAWGLRVLDFIIDRYRQELAWLDELASAARGGPGPGAGQRDGAGET